MPVRRAEAADLPYIVDLAEEEHAALVKGRHPFGGFDRRSVARTVSSYMRACDRSAVFVAVSMCGELKGYLIALETVAPFNDRFRFGMDAGFWSAGGSESAGRALIRAAEDWCRERGLAAFVLKRYVGFRDDAVSAYYGRAGYAPMEAWHIKELAGD